MPATYRCAACDANWQADRPTVECPHCGSRIIDRLEWDAPPYKDPYEPPKAAIGAASRPISSTAFSILYWLGLAAFILGCFLYGFLDAMNQRPNQGANEPNPFALLVLLVAFGGIGMFIAAHIVGLVKIFRAWELIQPLRRIDPFEAGMPSSGLAIGLLFVPLFNLYWNFVAFYGLATRANKYLLMSGIKSRPMNAGMAQTCCILTICTIIPCLGYLVALVNLFVYYFFILDVDRFRGSLLTTEIEFQDEFFDD